MIVVFGLFPGLLLTIIQGTVTTFTASVGAHDVALQLMVH
jgi:hypothetical protein